MAKADPKSHQIALEELYAEASQWKLNTGDETIHAKRMKGTFRTFKWSANYLWLFYFLVPLIRWDGSQAILFDIPHRQFHILGITILPQDFWMLSLLLLFFAILLAVVTALAGRVWCGYFCFQTVWTDVFTWIETKLEGAPAKRKKLDQAKWGFNKIRIKVIKHSLWLFIGFLTGMGFVSWFYDTFDLWNDLLNLTISSSALITLAMFAFGTYFLAGMLREQACFWLCPYARIQAVMIDATSIIPTYDFHRGEPRGRVKKKASTDEQVKGDCISCNQCVAVCPTGVDIREGSSEGCITCGLCIDACDTVMEKVGRPKGLIRYASLDELNGKEARPMLKRPRIWVYAAILTISLSGIVYGFSTMNAIELKVLHDRQPLYVVLSDGSIRNKYTIKVLNKLADDTQVKLNVTGIKGLKILHGKDTLIAKHGNVTSKTIFVTVPKKSVTLESADVYFYGKGIDANGVEFTSERKSFFMGPKR